MVRLGATFFLILVVSFVLHEAAHALTGLALGHPMRAGINQVVAAPGATMSARDATIVSAAGPVVTILIALVATGFARRSRIAMLFVLASFVSRALASVVSLSNPNDEMRISAALGLGDWTLPLVVTLGLGALALFAVRGHALGWRGWLALYLGGSLALAAIVGGDMVMPRIAVG